MKILILAALLLTACGGGVKSTSGGGTDHVFDDHWTPTAPEPGATPPGTMALGRQARRLSVAHLRKSIPLLFGGATWTSGSATSPTEVFTSLSRTLGEADYVQVTYNDTQPNPLFAKFMDDMAGQVCTKATGADGMKTDPAERAIVRYPEDVDQNLRFLRLKLHGIHVPDGSMDGLADLRKLYDDINGDMGGGAQRAWVGVCIAMVTAPEFMAY